MIPLDAVTLAAAAQPFTRAACARRFRAMAGGRGIGGPVCHNKMRRRHPLRIG